MLSASKATDAAVNIDENRRRWDRDYSWPLDGDEWDGQAALCGVSYAEWKQSLVDHLVVPYVTEDDVVVEIAPGHGRWTEHLLRRAKSLAIVDLSPTCLEFCRQRFARAPHLSCVLTPGTTLPGIASDSVDVVWSYDAFVHMAPPVIDEYLVEIARVLRAGGRAVLHHSNVRHEDGQTQDDRPGWRSAMTAERMRESAASAGLEVEDQLIYWDAVRRIGVPRFDDRITILRRPARR